MKSQYEKDIAISSQKIEFLQSQLSEAKTQHEETQKAHTALMNAFKSIEQEHGSTKVKSEEQIEVMRSEHIFEIQNL